MGALFAGVVRAPMTSVVMKHSASIGFHLQGEIISRTNESDADPAAITNPVGAVLYRWSESLTRPDANAASPHSSLSG
jgi:hypothetical protein